MAADNTRKSLDVFLNLVDVETSRYCLEKDARSGLAEGNGGTEDDDGDNKRDGRVGIEAPREVSEPDKEGGTNDSDISQSITHDVKKDSTHVEIMGVTTARLVVFGFRVVMSLVINRLALLGDAAVSVGAAVAKKRLISSVGSVVMIIGNSVLLALVVGAFTRIDLVHSAGINDGFPEG